MLSLLSKRAVATNQQQNKGKAGDGKPPNPRIVWAVHFGGGSGSGIQWVGSKLGEIGSACSSCASMPQPHQ